MCHPIVTILSYRHSVPPGNEPSEVMCSANTSRKQATLINLCELIAPKNSWENIEKRFRGSAASCKSLLFDTMFALFTSQQERVP